MKNILLLSAFLWINFSNANLNELLQCLGKEELFLHQKKIQNSRFKLNQELISLYLQLPKGYKINKKELKTICSAYPEVSYSLIRRSILTFDKLLLPKTQSDIESSLKDLEMFRVKNIKTLLHFATSLQASSNNHECLKKKIPQLENLMTNIQYTEQNQSLLKIIKEFKPLSSVVDRLIRLSREMDTGKIDCK